MDGKPRSRCGLVPIASSFAGQATILVAIISLLLTPVHAPRPGTASGWTTTAPAVIGAPYASIFTANIPPMYYAALTSTSAPPRSDTALTGAGSAALAAQDYIAIRRTSSGAVIATVAPPPGFQAFSMVTATSNAEEFLVAAQGRQPAGPDRPPSGAVNAAPVRLYTLQLGEPPGHGATLMPLPVSEIPGTQFWSAALSPDGSRLAVALTPGDNGLGGAVQEVRVYTLPGGTSTTWSVTAPGRAFNGLRLNPMLLSWSADNRLLGINWRDPAPGMRVLSAESPRGSLLAASRMIAFPESQSAGTAGCDSDATLIASAAMVVCTGHGTPPGGATPSSGGSRASILEFDATTGHPLRPVFPPSAVGGKPVQEVQLLWVSPSGHGFIVASYTGSSRPAAMTILNETVWLAEGIPLSPDATELAW